LKLCSPKISRAIAPLSRKFGSIFSTAFSELADKFAVSEEKIFMLTRNKKAHKFEQKE